MRPSSEALRRPAGRLKSHEARFSTVWLAVALVPLASGEVCGWWAEYAANSYTTDYQADPSLAVRGDGSFIVSWSSYGSLGNDTDTLSIQARRFAADGSAVDGLPEFQVNAATASHQFLPDVAADGDGNFVVVWNSTPGGPAGDMLGGASHPVSSETVEMPVAARRRDGPGTIPICTACRRGSSTRAACPGEISSR